MAGKLLLELLMEWKLLLEPWADGEGRAPAQPLGKRTPRQLYVGIIHYSFSFLFLFLFFFLLAYKMYFYVYIIY